MATESQLVDFSLDPYQVEEEALNSKLKAALAKKLRTSAGVPSWNGAELANAAFDRVSGAFEETDLRKQKTALGEKFQNDLSEVGSAYGPEISNLLRNPATRAIGLGEIKSVQESKRDAAELAARRAARRPSGLTGSEGQTDAAPTWSSGGYTLDDIQDMMRSRNPRTVAEAKWLHEQYFKATDPSHTAAGNTGKSIPGAVESFAAREAAREAAKAGATQPFDIAKEDRELIDVPFNGGTQKMTRGEYKRQTAGTPVQGSSGVAPSPATLAPSPAENPATGGNRPVNATGATPARSPGNVGPNLDTFKMLERSGANATSPKGAYGEWQVMPDNFLPGEDSRDPEIQRRAATRVIQDATRRYGPQNDRAIVAYYNGGWKAGDAVAAGKPPPAKETQDYLARYDMLKQAAAGERTGVTAGPGAPTQSALGTAVSALNPISSAQASPAPAQALPSSIQAKYGPPTLARPQTPMGVSDPIGTKEWHARTDDNRKAVTEWQSKLRDLPRVGEILTTIEGIGGDVYGGPYGGTIAGIETGIKTAFPLLGMKTSKTASNTQILKSQSEELIGAIQKQYGTNPSNIDYRAAAARVPNGEMTPEARAELVGLMRKGVEREKATTPRILSLINEGYELKIAQQIANDEYSAQLEQRQNPTKAGGDVPSQPPAAVPQAQPPVQGTPPGPRSGGQISQGDVVGAAAGIAQNRGGTGSWGEQPPNVPPPPPQGGAPTRPQPGPVDPTALMNGAAPRNPTEARAKEMMEQAQRENSPQLWEMAWGLLQKAAALPGQIASPQGGAGTIDAYKNIGRGAQQLFTGNYNPVEEQRIRAEQERKMSDPAYAAAMRFSSIANPTALIGGAGAGVLRNAASAFAQNVLEPNMSLGDKLGSALLPTALGGTVAAVSKALPRTDIPKNTPTAIREAYQDFPSVKPTGAQLDPNSWSGKLGRLLGIDDYRQLSQIKGVTKDLMSKAGMEGSEITEKGIAATRKDLGDKYNAMFHDTGKPVGTVMSTADQAAVRDHFKGILERRVQGVAADPTRATIGANQIFNDSNSPALNRLHATLSDATGPIKLNPKDLHEAWKEVGAIQGVSKEAAGAVRGLLEDLVTKGMSPRKADEFKKLNSKFATLQDIDRIYSESGIGRGAASGYLAPSKLEAGAGRGPNSNSATDQAAALVKGLNLKDYAPGEIPTGVTGAVRTGVNTLVSPILSALDNSMLSSSAGKKKMIELLRAGAVRGVPSALSKDIPGD